MTNPIKALAIALIPAFSAQAGGSPAAGMPRPQARLHPTPLGSPMNLHDSHPLTAGITFLMPESRTAATAIDIPPLATCIPPPPVLLPTAADKTRIERVRITAANPDDPRQTPTTAVTVAMQDALITPGITQFVMPEDDSARNGRDPARAILMRHGFRHDEMDEIKELYRKTGIQLNDKTVVRTFRQANQIGKLIPLDGHAGVYKVAYRTGPGDQIFHGVFKEEKSLDEQWAMMRSRNLLVAMGIVAEHQVDPLGIFTSVPYRIANRNVAVYQMSLMFGRGWEVIPRTEFAIADGKLGFAMEFVHGEQPGGEHRSDITDHPAGLRLKEVWKETKDNPDLFGNELKKYGLYHVQFVGHRVVAAYGSPNPKINYSDPILLRNAILLQTLDGVVGQGDRNCGNWFITFRSGNRGSASGAMGVDNDMTLGRKPKTINDIFGIPETHAATFSPIIDRQIYADIMEKSAKDVEDRLDGLVDPAEIEASKCRLQDTQFHYKKARDEEPDDRKSPAEKSIIDPSEWEYVVDDPRFNPANNYLARAKAEPSS
jgi:hypothetical protein